MSDWGAVYRRPAGVAAGLDLEMPSSGGVTDREIVRAVRAGRLDAVSYTHLDVYKRQVREHNGFARRMPVVEDQIKVANHRISDQMCIRDRRYSVPVLPLPPAEREQRSFDFII